MAVKDETALMTEWIEEDPHRRGPADVRIKGYGQAIWALIGDLPLYQGDLQALADDVNLPLEAVEAAEVYYRRHRAVIDARIAANSAYFKR